MTTPDKAAERKELRKMLPKNISRPLSYEDKIRFSCFSEREMLDFAQQVLERERASRWIPVTERLPEPDSYCLVWVKAKICPSGFPAIDDWIMLTECPVAFSTISIETGYGWREFDFDDITHWQLITEPMEGA